MIKSISQAAPYATKGVAAIQNSLLVDIHRGVCSVSGAGYATKCMFKEQTNHGDIKFVVETEMLRSAIKATGGNFTVEVKENWAIFRNGDVSFTVFCHPVEDFTPVDTEPEGAQTAFFLDDDAIESIKAVTNFVDTSDEFSNLKWVWCYADNGKAVFCGGMGHQMIWVHTGIDYAAEQPVFFPVKAITAMEGGDEVALGTDGSLIIRNDVKFIQFPREMNWKMPAFDVLRARIKPEGPFFHIEPDAGDAIVRVMAATPSTHTDEHTPVVLDGQYATFKSSMGGAIGARAAMKFEGALAAPAYINKKALLLMLRYGAGGNLYIHEESYGDNQGRNVPGRVYCFDETGNICMATTLLSFN